jgi:hypothetical protein
MIFNLHPSTPAIVLTRMDRTPRSRHGLERRRQRRPDPRKPNTSLASGQSSALRKFISSLPSDDVFGDLLPPAGEDTGRIVLLNTDSIPEFRNDHRQCRLFDWWRQDSVSIAMITEMGRFWPAVPEEEQWKERTRDQFEGGIHSTLAYNIHERRTNTEGSRQWGGVDTFAIGDMCSRVKESGQDPSGLGRWSWIRLAGKLLGRQELETFDNQSEPQFSDVVVVSAYRPSPLGTGVNTVWAQHRSRFVALKERRDPRAVFLDDLQHEIRQ